MKKFLLFPIILVCILLSCSDSDNLEVVLVDNLQREAGEYAVVWDQRFENSAPVPEGVYRIDMETDNFNASLYIEITSIDITGPFVKSDGIDISLKPIPDSYALIINKTVFGPGEEIEIQYDLPQADRIRLTVTWINLDIAPV